LTVLRAIVAHLEAALPLAERLCEMARDWHDSASEALGRVDRDPAQGSRACCGAGDGHAGEL